MKLPPIGGDPNRKPASELEDIFLTHMRGEMAFPDYLTHNARWVSKNTQTYEPLPYPVLAADVRAYAHRRVNGRQGRDSDVARKLARWTALTREIHAENVSRQELLLWAQEKLMQAGLKSHVEPVLGAIERFMGHRVDREWEVLSHAQNLDREDRIREERGK